MVRIENAPLQSRPDEVYGVERAQPTLPRKLLAGTIGTLLTATSVAIDLENRSGSYTLHTPTVETIDEEYHAASADQSEYFESDTESKSLVTISWNKWRGKYRPVGIRNMIEEFDPDVIAMQEATPELAKWYAKQFPEWWIVFAEASRNLDGTQGQITMLRYRPTQIKTLSMAGSSWTEKAGHLAMNNLHYIQARRAAVAVTFKKGDEAHTVSNVHVTQFTGHPIHQSQTSEYIDWMTQNGVHVSLGDYNDEYDGMTASHNDTGYVVSNITDPTHRDGRTIDFCVYDPEAVELASAKALPEPVTDHYPVVCEFVRFDADKPADDLSTLPKGFLFSVEDESDRG